MQVALIVQPIRSTDARLQLSSHHLLVSLPTGLLAKLLILDYELRYSSCNWQCFKLGNHLAWIKCLYSSLSFTITQHCLFIGPSGLLPDTRPISHHPFNQVHLRLISHELDERSN